MTGTTQTPSLYDLAPLELNTWLTDHGQPSYRAKQILEALYRKDQPDPASWTALPKSLREQFARDFPAWALSPVEDRQSADGTRKWLWKLPDGQFVETVLIPAASPLRRGISGATAIGVVAECRTLERSASAAGMVPPRSAASPLRRGISSAAGMVPPRSAAESRRTLCVSTQVGCAYRCAFCASGMKGFLRDLSAGEIVQQVVQVNRFLKGSDPAGQTPTGSRVSNIVFMGMGEPLSNYANLIRAIRILNSPNGLRIGARKITISTVGLVPKMELLSREGLQLELAVSLHAPNDEIRGKLMPVNKKYPLVRLLAACRAFVKATKRLITFEYILIDGVNDRPEHAEELAQRLKGLFCKVNLIPCHPIPGAPWGRPPQPRMLEFEKTLRKKGITCTLRQSRGLDIEGACGQLRLRHEEKTPAH